VDDLHVGFLLWVVGSGGKMPGGLRVRFDAVLIADFRGRVCGVAVAVGGGAVVARPVRVQP
jgi:hypothetical protein